MINLRIAVRPELSGPAETMLRLTAAIAALVASFLSAIARHKPHEFLGFASVLLSPNNRMSLRQISRLFGRQDTSFLSENRGTLIRNLLSRFQPLS